MSSLDVDAGEILSIGWVSIERGAVALASAGHHLVRAEKSVGQSAAIHSLRDCELREAGSPGEMLEQLLDAARGKILVFHNAALDLAFLDRACVQAYGAPLLFPVIDTMLQEKALLQRRDVPIKSGDLRLHTCRERYHLPPHRGHNALLDALATAELLLAMAAHRSAGRPFPVGSLL
jgi:DNA polymerase-3 subunit epsilon